MCTGITIAWRDIPTRLIRKHQLDERIIQRSETADKEILFMQRHRQPLLPVFYEGELQILPWGNRHRHNNAPLAWWCEVATLESGAWSMYHPEPVEILANFGLERGVWFQAFKAQSCTISTNNPASTCSCNPRPTTTRS